MIAQDEIRRELVAADVSVKDLRIDGNLLVLFRRWRLAFQSLRRMVGAVLMVYETGRAAVCIDDERDLRVEVFEKEVAGTLGEDLEPPLTGSLRVQPVAVPRDRLDEIRSELVTAGVFLEDCGVHLHLLALFRRPDLIPGRVVAVLMEHDARCASGVVDDEGELRVDHLQEKFAGALGEDFESRLVGGLCVELVALARNCDDEIRGELVAAGVFLEDGGIHLHFLALFRRLEEWEGGIEKMEADVVGAGVRRRVRENDDAGAALRLEADPGAVAAGAAVVPDDLVSVAGRNVPAEADLEVRHAGGRRGWRSSRPWSLPAATSPARCSRRETSAGRSRSSAARRLLPASVGPSSLPADARRCDRERDDPSSTSTA